MNLDSYLLPFWIIDTTFRSSTLYKLTGATDTPALWENERPGPDEYRTEVESKYIHYFKDERLVKFERISDTESQTNHRLLESGSVLVPGIRIPAGTEYSNTRYEYSGVL